MVENHQLIDKADYSRDFRKPNLFELTEISKPKTNRQFHLFPNFQQIPIEVCGSDLAFHRHLKCENIRLLLPLPSDP